MTTEEMLKSKQNIFRQAVIDYMHGDSWTILGMVDWALEQDVSKERLVLFTERRLHIEHWFAQELVTEIMGGCYVH